MAKPRTKPLTGICKQCSKEFAYKFYGAGRPKGGGYNRNQKFCSKGCADQFQTKGWNFDQHGYMVANRSNGNGRSYIFEHRVVMERHLGRPLAKHETVHHKNGIRHDNRLENLELWSKRHGAGQRVEDKIEFARSILSEYGVDAPLTSMSDAITGIAGLI